MYFGALIDWKAAACSVIFAVMLSGQARPAQPANAGPEFEAASLRPAAPVVGEFAAGPFGGPGSGDPTRIRGINLTLKALLMRAYQVRYEQISGPAWIETERYDLMATVRSGATREQVNEMLRNLLLERFKLALHHETRDLPVYELVQTNKRTMLKEASAVANTAETSMPTPGNKKGFPEIPAERTTGLWQDLNPAGRVRVVGRNQPVSELIRAIGNQAGRPVVDKTALAGRYDFVLEYAVVVGAIGAMGMPMPAPPPIALASMGTETETDPPPPLTTAIEEQLGLKLKPAKGALDVIVIDQAQRTPLQD
jgi:uncharacterized protein (TIGR03435 family)